jgi:hypothetical protein
MMLGMASPIIRGLWYNKSPESRYWQPLWAKDIMTWSYPQSENEHKQCVNDLVCCILYNPRAVLLHLPIFELLAAFIGNITSINTATPQNEPQYSVNSASTEYQLSVNRVSPECQWFWVLHLVKSQGSDTAYTPNHHIGSHYVQKTSQHGHCTILTLSVNRVSTT